MAKVIATIKKWGHTKIDSNILLITANSFGLYNINIHEILTHHSIQIQHFINSKIHFSDSKQKYSQIFKNIKHNFDPHAENNSKISYLISTNKSLNKKSKKDIIRYKNKVKKIIESKAFKSIAFLDHFK